MNESPEQTSKALADPVDPDPVVELHDVSVTYDMKNGVSTVLDSVDLEIERDEILGVVGESGSGKSMFASALLDAVVDPGIVHGDVVYTPEDGDAVTVTDLSGDDLKRFRWEQISMVFQGAMDSFNPTLTLKGHFTETLDAHGVDRTVGMERARRLLSNVYLDPDRVLESYPHELSGGMKQRALIALSLLLEPEVLVMDEPTAALDLLMQRSILNLLSTLQEEYNLTIVFITHDLPLVSGLADRLAVMYAFEFVEVETTEAILSDARHPYTRALLNTVPDLTKPLSEMEIIEGTSPDSKDIPSGCSYRTRCPMADSECRIEDPKLQNLEDGGQIACHHWKDVSEEMPLVQKDSDGTSPAADPTPSSSGKPVVAAQSVDVHFDHGESLLDRFRSDSKTVVRAVDGVDLEIYEEDVVTLVGESGCGKTTLGKALIGGQRPTDGHVTYRGQDVWDAKDLRGNVEIPYQKIRAALQMIHQDPGDSLNPNHTVERIIGFPLEEWRPDLDRADRRHRVYAMLERVGMTPVEDYASRYPHQLSGGEKQRVALIRALLMNPDLVLADEAVSALDVSLRVEIMDLMLDLQEEFGTSYLFISHNLANARYLSGRADGRIAIMYLGELVEVAPAQELINNPKHPYTQVLKWAATDLDRASESTERPVRSIDIPDPVDPPSGCRFHTRCPHAREICRETSPDLRPLEPGVEHTAACFRVEPDHDYWDSPPLYQKTPDEGQQ